MRRQSEHESQIRGDSSDSWGAPKKIEKVVVLGGGSAGLLVALTLAKRLPQLTTVVVRSTKIGVIGVGEGTIASIGRFLHQFLDIDPVRFHREVHPSIKLGIKFVWGPRPFFNYSFTSQFSGNTPRNFGLTLPRGYYCQEDASFADGASALMVHGKAAFRNGMGQPKSASAFAYHLENERLVKFLESITTEQGIEKIDAIVSDVKSGPQGVEAMVLEDGTSIEADLFVDCSGFNSQLLGKSQEEPFVDFNQSLYCDRAIVGGWPRTDEPYLPYTTAETMNSGWCWQIEHDQIINRGYVYSSQFISDEQAEVEFRQRNPKITSTRTLKFRCGVHRRAWVKNVVAIGNAYGFVEPLEATAIGMICSACGHLATILGSSDGSFDQVQRDLFNRLQDDNWEMIRDYLAVHYKFNSRLETPFWKACQNDIQLGEAQRIVDYYRSVGPDLSALAIDLRRDLFGIEGYLAMLLGQNVEYHRGIKLTPQEQQSWATLKKQLADSASNGVDMPEYLSQLRTGEATLPVARGAA